MFFLINYQRFYDFARSVCVLSCYVHGSKMLFNVKIFVQKRISPHDLRVSRWKIQHKVSIATACNLLNSIKCQISPLQSQEM